MPMTVVAMSSNSGSPALLAANQALASLPMTRRFSALPPILAAAVTLAARAKSTLDSEVPAESGHDFLL